MGSLTDLFTRNANLLDEAFDLDQNDQLLVKNPDKSAYIDAMFRNFFIESMQGILSELVLPNRKRKHDWSDEFQDAPLGAQNIVPNTLGTEQPSAAAGAPPVGGAAPGLSAPGVPATPYQGDTRTPYVGAGRGGPGYGQAPQGAPGPVNPRGNTLGSLISSGEGSYNSFNRGNAGDSGGARVNFSNMTIGQIMQLQSLPKGDPNRLFAVGKYQIIPLTMQGAIASLNLDPNTKFTPDVQEHLFRNYLISEKQPAVKAYITGQSNDIGSAQMALANEFASVANPTTGRSVYGGVGGNVASISAARAAQALQAERQAYQSKLASGTKPDEAWNGLTFSPQTAAQNPPSSNQQAVDLTRYATGSAAPGGPSSVEGLHPEFSHRIQTMVNAMPPEIAQKFEIISGFRDPQRQGQVNPGVTNSHHSYGMAADTTWDPDVRNWISQNGAKFGLGYPLASDPKEGNHMEPLENGTRVAPSQMRQWVQYYNKQQPPQTQVASTPQPSASPTGQPPASSQAPQQPQQYASTGPTPGGPSLASAKVLPIGDSLALGMGKLYGDNRYTHGGWNSDMVNRQLVDRAIANGDVKGKVVVLSGGASNNGGDSGAAARDYPMMLQKLNNAGAAHVVVMGVGPYTHYEQYGYNKIIGQAADQAGAHFTGPLANIAPFAGTDYNGGIHPNDYRPIFNHVQQHLSTPPSNTASITPPSSTKMASVTPPTTSPPSTSPPPTSPANPPSNPPSNPPMSGYSSGSSGASSTSSGSSGSGSSGSSSGSGGSGSSGSSSGSGGGGSSGSSEPPPEATKPPDSEPASMPSQADKSAPVDKPVQMAATEKPSDKQTANESYRRLWLELLRPYK